jgi:hypothetical protein
MRSAIENQMQHQVVFSYIFVQLLYIDSLPILRHTGDGYKSDLNMFVNTTTTTTTTTTTNNNNNNK